MPLTQKNQSKKPCRGLLLLGPTGSGKTPLGDCIEARGLWNHRWVHFDFGANLREAVTQNRPDDFLSANDLAFLRRVLETGALLEDGHFPIAESILRSFLARRNSDGTAWVAMNGLPRHVGQALAVDRLVRIEAVVELACSDEVVMERIRSNAGGDRTHRTDDDLNAVRKKLALFLARTEPLIRHYEAAGVPVLAIGVGAADGPARMFDRLTLAPPTGGCRKG